jgi:hypothetical protein
LRIRKINPAVECSFVMQALWSDRRTPSTVAAGNEPPMNPAKRTRMASKGLRVAAEG